MNILKARHFWFKDWLINKIAPFEHPDEIAFAIASFLSSCKDSLLKGDPLNSALDINGVKVDMFEDNIHNELIDYPSHY